jgi:hypothetical protein
MIVLVGVSFVNMAIFYRGVIGGITCAFI